MKMTKNKGNAALKKLASMSAAAQSQIHNQNMGMEKQPKKGK